MTTCGINESSQHKKKSNTPHLVSLALGARIPLVSAPIPVGDGHVELDSSHLDILEHLNHFVITVDQRDVASLSEQIPWRSKQSGQLVVKFEDNDFNQEKACLPLRSYTRINKDVSNVVVKRNVVADAGGVEAPVAGVCHDVGGERLAGERVHRVLHRTGSSDGLSLIVELLHTLQTHLDSLKGAVCVRHLEPTALALDVDFRLGRDGRGQSEGCSTERELHDLG